MRELDYMDEFDIVRGGEREAVDPPGTYVVVRAAGAPPGLPADTAALCMRAATLRAESEARVRAWRLLQRTLPGFRSGVRSPAAPARPRPCDDGPAETLRAPPSPPDFTAVAIAASAGGLQPLLRILSGLPADFPAAILVVQHRSADSRLAEFLAARVRLPVIEAGDGDPLVPGTVLVAPAHRHVRVRGDGRLSVRAGERINFVCPCADLAFESLAAAFAERTVAVVLSGCGSDGAAGSRAVRRAGGVVIAEHERSAAFPDMPVAAVDLGKVDLVLAADRIASALVHLTSTAANGPGDSHPTLSPDLGSEVPRIGA